MTITIGEGTTFSDLGFRINTTVYSKAGDNITRKLSQPQLNPDTYARRHYVIRGQFDSSFPNTNISPQIGGIVGTVWPVPGNIETDTFTITAAVDDSAYVCIIPVGQNKKIIHSVDQLTGGNPYITSTGYAYISTVDYQEYNGEYKKTGSVLVCANNPIVLIPVANGQIIKFASIDSDSINIQP